VAYSKTEIDASRYTKTEINTSFKRSFVDLLVVAGWSFSTTTITLNVESGHGIVATDTIWLDGLLSTTNAPNGEWTVGSVTATTIVFTAVDTPTGTPTVLNAIVYKTTYVDGDAIGANPTAKIYSDGTIIGKTNNGGYTRYTDGTFIAYVYKSVVVPVSSSESYSWVLPLPLIVDDYDYTSNDYNAQATAIASNQYSDVIVDLESATQTVVIYRFKNSYTVSSSTIRGKLVLQGRYR